MTLHLPLGRVRFNSSSSGLDANRLKTLVLGGWLHEQETPSPAALPQLPLAEVQNEIEQLPTRVIRGDIPQPNPDSMTRAIRWIATLYSDTYQYDRWFRPFISSDENGDVVFEWWRDERKLTVFVTPTTVDYIKVWGVNIFTEMEDGTLHTDATVRDVWQWLVG